MNSRMLRLATLTLVSVVGMAMAAALAQSADNAFIAQIKEMNAQLTSQDVSGLSIITGSGDDVEITLIAKGLPEGMRLAHIHGFVTGEAATCPGPSADSNGDGIVDLIETEPAAGVTLIPFNADPAGAMILSDTYPVASGSGLLIYHAKVSLAALNAVLAKDYKISGLNLADRVIFIHGVADGVNLASTVQSLPGVPASVTVPIACGELNPF